MKLLGKIACALPKWMGGGHKRGKFVRGFGIDQRILACPRCGRETRYKLKATSGEAK